MTRLHTLAAVSALALSAALALGGTAAAQEAAAPLAPPGAAAPAAQGEAAGEASEQRTISGRELMTREERRSFRRQMREATPEQRQVLWAQKHAELTQRAAQRGLVLAEAGPRWRGEGGERGEGGGRMPARAPAAP